MRRVSRPPAEGRAWQRWAVPAGVTLLAGVAVLRLARPLGAIRSVQVSWGDLAAAAAIYAVFAALRGVRFRLLLARRLSWSEAVRIGWIYSAACSVLPGGLGEASLPALYGSAADATAALVTTRVQDLLSWLLVLVAAGFAAGQALPAAAAPALGVGLAITAAGALFTFSGAVRRPVLRLARRLPVPALAGFLGEFDGRLGVMARDRGSWGATAALRLASIAKYYIALRAFGLPVTPLAAAVGGALVALALTIPLQGLAGLGTVELVWIAALALFGVPWPQAAVAAFGTHAVLLASSVLLGGLAMAKPARRAIA